MVEVTIENSFSKVIGLEVEPFKKLRKALSYTDESYSYKSQFKPAVKYLIDIKGNFPTGLLHRVTQFLKTYQIGHITSDKRIKPKITLPQIVTANWGGVKHYEAQLAALEACKATSRGIVSMPTGTGKSRVIALIANHYCVRTLIIVPTVEIKKQLSADLLAVFGNTTFVVVENIDSKNLKNAKDFDCLIIDEAHHVAASTYQKLNQTAWKNIYYRFFLTATPFRNQDHETLLFEGIAGNLIYKLSYIDAIKNNYIVPIEAYCIHIKKQPTNAFTWNEVYSELVVNNKERNLAISYLACRLNSIGKSTLILVKEVKHGQILSEMTGLPFVSGQDEESRDYIRQFNSGEIKALIGTEGVIGEGVDTKPCEYVVIAGLGKAKSAFMQKVGRAVRTYQGKESAKVILFRDPSHKFLRNHFKEQCKILIDEYGVKTLDLEL